MRNITLAILTATFVGLAAAPAPVRAGHDDDDDVVIAAIAGFAGGLLAGTAIDDNGPSPHVSVGVTVGDRHHPGYGHYHGRRHGHWDWTTVRVWVPGYWAVDRDCRRGRPDRVWVAGHYEHRREKVWVSHGDRYCRTCR